MISKVIEKKTMSPLLLMKIQQHLLLQLVFTIIRGNRIIMAIESMNKSLSTRFKVNRHILKNKSERHKVNSTYLNTGFLQMANVGGSLSWFLAGHGILWVDQSKSIQNYFSLDGLNWINDHSHCSWIELFKGLIFGFKD